MEKVFIHVYECVFLDCYCHVSSDEWWKEDEAQHFIPLTNLLNINLFIHVSRSLATFQHRAACVIVRDTLRKLQTLPQTVSIPCGVSLFRSHCSTWRFSNHSKTFTKRRETLPLAAVPFSVWETLRLRSWRSYFTYPFLTSKILYCSFTL